MHTPRIKPLAAMLAVMRIERAPEVAEEPEKPRPYLPPLVQQIQEARAALERLAREHAAYSRQAPAGARQVDARLARRLGVPLEELRQAVEMGEIPAKVRRGVFYVGMADVDRWMEARAQV